MQFNANDPVSPIKDDSPEALTTLLREDILELVDGLVPREIVNHVQRAVVIIESIDRNEE